MAEENRIVRYDNDLKIEAYYFKGIVQKFPNHFHEHYVFGFIKSGRRFLSCKNKEYIIKPGDLVIFNPLDNHACEQIEGDTLDYCCVNIEKDVMRSIVKVVTGKSMLPMFKITVDNQSEASEALQDLHTMIMNEEKDFKKEEALYFLIDQLLTMYAIEEVGSGNQTSEEIQRACDYMESHYMESITLDILSQVSGLNKYTLLRNFTVQRGITPYQYVSAIRINKAKKLLEMGIPLIDVALQSGFSDQSHFTRFFKNFIGLTPKMYQSIHSNQNN